MKPTTPKIVLVDADVEVGGMLNLALSASGHAVQWYQSGLEALDALLAMPSGAAPKVLLLAVDLVGLDGHTIHEQLKLARPGAFLVVFLASRGGDSDQIRAFTAGALDYMVKPLSIPVLLAKVNVWLHLCGTPA